MESRLTRTAPLKWIPLTGIMPVPERVAGHSVGANIEHRTGADTEWSLNGAEARWFVYVGRSRGARESVEGLGMALVRSHGICHVWEALSGRIWILGGTSVAFAALIW